MVAVAAARARFATMLQGVSTARGQGHVVVVVDVMEVQAEGLARRREGCTKKGGLKQDETVYASPHSGSL